MIVYIVGLTIRLPKVSNTIDLPTLLSFFQHYLPTNQQNSTSKVHDVDYITSNGLKVVHIWKTFNLGEGGRISQGHDNKCS